MRPRGLLCFILSVLASAAFASTASAGHKDTIYLANPCARVANDTSYAEQHSGSCGGGGGAIAGDASEGGDADPDDATINRREYAEARGHEYLGSGGALYTPEAGGYRSIH